MSLKIVNNENPLFLDIDDTIILYPEADMDPSQLKNLGYKEFTDFIGNKFLALPSEKHIKLIKYYKARGFYIIAWSGNGFKHAEHILKQLNLLDYIDQIMSKSSRYVDDVDCQHWMGKRIYLEKGQKV